MNIINQIVLIVSLVYSANTYQISGGVSSIYGSTQATDEICNNAIDDDNDGLIDLNDPDCDCELIRPVSRIPNPSFEDFDCCPDNKSQLDCATSWIQASNPTTDFIHTCGWMGWQEFPPPMPFPDGDGIVGLGMVSFVLMERSKPIGKNMLEPA